MKRKMFILIILGVGFFTNMHAQTTCIDVIFPYDDYAHRIDSLYPEALCPPYTVFPRLTDTIIPPTVGTCSGIYISDSTDYGRISIVDIADANVIDTANMIGFYYYPTSNCAPIDITDTTNTQIDRFTIIIPDDPACDSIKHNNNNDNIINYTIELKFDYNCETPNDLFCCVASDMLFPLNVALANDTMFIEDNYDVDTFAILVDINLTSPPQNGSLVNDSELGISYLPNIGFTGLDSLSYQVGYIIATTEGDTITICDEQTCYLFVEDCHINTMKDELCVAIGDTICVEPLANDTVEHTLDDPILNIMECQNLLNGLTISPQLSPPLLLLDGTCDNAFSFDSLGTYTYIYDVYAGTSGYATDSIIITVKTCREKDSLTLVTLYDSTNGADWTNTWDLSQPIDTWYGINLDENGCVSCIDMDGLFNCAHYFVSGNGNNLSGNIPAALGDLNSLVFLDLGSNSGTGTNNLSGNIPSELGNLSNLDYLDLRNNLLNDNIPATLGDLRGLTHLFLSGNLLAGSLPSELGDLSNLTYLSLHTNNINGSIPPNFGNLSKLQHLFLYENQLTGSIPSELENLNKLIRIRLFTNQLTGSIPPELGNLNNLKLLDIADNHLTGSIPLELGKLDNLEILLLNFNQLTGNIPYELGSLANLQLLGLSSNELSGCYDENLSNLCGQLLPDYNNNISISDDTNLDIDWENFCTGIHVTCEGNERKEEKQEVTFTNYPNPFTQQTTIEFTLIKDAPVTLSVFNSLGRKVATLLDAAPIVTGTHRVVLDGADYSSGVYYYTIRADDFFGTQKMTLIK